MNIEKINNLYSLIESIYLTANREELDIEDFVSKFLNSKISQIIFDNFESHYFNSYNIVIDLKDQIEKKKETIDEDFISYIAYIQVVFFFNTKLDTKTISSYISVRYLKSNFDLYHTLDDEIVTERIIDDYNLKNNPMRKIRSKQNKIIFDEGIDLYISKRVVSSLYPYPKIDFLKYHYDDFPYLGNDEYFFHSYIYKNMEELKVEINKAIYEKYCFKKEGIYILLINEKDENKIDKIVPLLEKNECFQTNYLITKRYIIKIKRGYKEKYYFTYTSSEHSKVKLQYDLRFLDKYA